MLEQQRTGTPAHDVAGARIVHIAHVTGHRPGAGPTASLSEAPVSPAVFSLCLVTHSTHKQSRHIIIIVIIIVVVAVVVVIVSDLT